MGKTKDLFKKIRDIGQKWHGSRSSRRYEERGQEYTEELYKKDLHDPDNHDGVITHLEPNILECKVKQVLGNITMKTKLWQVMKFQLSYFKS